MPHDPEKYLEDILSSCDFLLEFTANRTVVDYGKDRPFRSAVERELQIVGEALMQLEKVSPVIASQITAHRQIISFRHVLVHGYHSLNHDTVWSVLRDHLPKLRDDVWKLLSKR
ncbi:MAG: HepT-like ribonuclease domain-containing protein [Planctomycetota bacterium]